MSDVIYFDKPTSLEDKFHYVCDKLRYCFKKIETYDDLYNRFKKIESSLDQIKEETQTSLGLIMQSVCADSRQEMLLKQLNQRVTDESKRYDLKHDEVKSFYCELSDRLTAYIMKNSDYISSVKEELESYLNNQNTRLASQTISLDLLKEQLKKILEKVSQKISEIDSLQKDHKMLKEKNSHLDALLLELSKENSRLRNAIVKERASK
jgi:hypothetical protein